MAACYALIAVVALVSSLLPAASVGAVPVAAPAAERAFDLRLAPAPDASAASPVAEAGPAPARPRAASQPPGSPSLAPANRAPAAAPSSLGWSRVPGIDGNVRWLAVGFSDPRLVFAAADGTGVYRTQDAGATWTLLPVTGLTDKTVQTVALCPTTGRVFAGTWGGGVFRFNGSGWSAVNNGLPQLYVSALTCDFQGVLMAGTYSRGVWRTISEGAAWGPANTGLQNQEILGLSSVPGLTGAGTGNGGYKTLDNGSTWSLVGMAGNRVYDFAFDRFNESRIWAAAIPAGVQVSSDQGVTWTGIGGPSDAYTVQQGSDNLLYAGTRDHGVLRWDGVQWVNDNLPVSRVYLLRLSTEGRLVAGTSDGIWIASALAPTATPSPSPTPTRVIEPVVEVELRSESPNPAEWGDAVTYLIDYRVSAPPAPGPVIASNVVITNAVPAGVSFIPGSILPAGAGTESGGVVTWELGELESGAAGTLSYRVQLPDPTATATATSTPTNTPEGPTPTATATPTATGSPTASPTPTNTHTATFTPPATWTSTATPSRTPSASPTPSVTLTPSITPTPSTTPSPTETSTPESCTQGRISGYVFEDQDRDGAMEDGDVGQGGVQVRLYKDGAIVETASTNPIGWYAFAGLAYGDYEVEIVMPEGYANTNAMRPLVTLEDCSKLVSFGTTVCPALVRQVWPVGSGATTVDPLPNCPGGGENLYIPGTEVEVRGVPGTGYQFSTWSGDFSDDFNPVIIRVSTSKNLTANFVACLPLTTAVAPETSGTIVPNPAPNCDGGGVNLYNPNSLVTLDAKPANDWFFKNWTGDASGSGTQVMIAMTVARNVTAQFGACLSVTPQVNPPGAGTASVTTASNCQGGTKYLPGTTVGLTTTSAGAYYLFREWTTTSGTLASPLEQTTNLVLGTTDAVATANYNVCKTLTTAAFPPEDGTVEVLTPPNCGGDRYLPGAAVSIKATPKTGRTFKEWSGGVPPANIKDNPVTITMDADKSVTALFDIMCYTLGRAANPEGAGEILASPAPDCPTDPTKYKHGATVSLTAKPGPGYQFVDWTGGASGTANPVSVTMDGNKSVTANFRSCFALTRQVNPAGGGAILAVPAPNCEGGGDNMYNPGQDVELTAQPAADYAFVDWTGPVTNPISNPTHVLMDAAKTVTANFQACLTVTARTEGGYAPIAQVTTPPTCPGTGTKYLPKSTVSISTSTTNVYDVFKGWTATSGTLGSPTAPNTTLALGTADAIVTATYDTCKVLTAVPVPSNGGTIGRDPAASCGPDGYPTGTVVTLTASPAVGYVFSEWKQGLTGSLNPTTITMDTDKTVEAHFVDACYTLTRAVVGGGAVNVDQGGNCPTEPTNPDKYKHGTVLQLTAAPADNYAFDFWAGDVGMGQEKANPLTVTMDAPKALTANFAACVGLTSQSVPLEGGTASIAAPNCQGGAKYQPNVAVAVSAVPSGGYNFTSWSAPSGSFGDPAAAGTTYTPVAGVADVVLTANFAASGNAARARYLPLPLSAGFSGAGRTPAFPAPPRAPAGALLVVNRGAYAYWDFAGLRHEVQSNVVLTGQANWQYLPLIRR